MASLNDLMTVARQSGHKPTYPGLWFSPSNTPLQKDVLVNGYNAQIAQSMNKSPFCSHFGCGFLKILGPVGSMPTGPTSLKTLLSKPGGLGQGGASLATEKYVPLGAVSPSMLHDFCRCMDGLHSVVAMDAGIQITCLVNFSDAATLKYKVDWNAVHCVWTYKEQPNVIVDFTKHQQCAKINDLVALNKFVAGVVRIYGKSIGDTVLQPLFPQYIQGVSMYGRLRAHAQLRQLVLDEMGAGVLVPCTFDVLRPFINKVEYDTLQSNLACLGNRHTLQLELVSTLLMFLWTRDIVSEAHIEVLQEVVNCHEFGTTINKTLRDKIRHAADLAPRDKRRKLDNLLKTARGSKALWLGYAEMVARAICKVAHYQQWDAFVNCIVTTNITNPRLWRKMPHQLVNILNQDEATMAASKMSADILCSSTGKNFILTKLDVRPGEVLGGRIIYPRPPGCFVISNVNFHNTHAKMLLSRMYQCSAKADMLHLTFRFHNLLNTLVDADRKSVV